MFVKILSTNKGLMLIDELERFIGYTEPEEFTECMIDDNPRTIDDETYWWVDKSKILKVAKNG